VKRVSALVLASGLAVGAAPARALEWTFDVALTGGVAIPWDGPEHAGNTYGLMVGFDLDMLRLSLGLSGVAPDSRLDGVFETIFVQAQYYVIGFQYGFGPYAVAGIGIATGDRAPPPKAGQDPPVRWVPEGPQALGMLGVGCEYGYRGLFVGLDFRAYNWTHGGFNLTAGYRF
jgi:hypothetical protein